MKLIRLVTYVRCTKISTSITVPKRPIFRSPGNLLDQNHLYVVG